MLPAGLRAIWLIWCSPCPLVTVRVDAAAQASPETTWPEDLHARERGRVGGAPAGRAGPWLPPQPRQPGGGTHVSVRTHLAESRMSHTLM